MRCGSAVALDHAGTFALEAAAFVDASGEADLAHRAGAPTRYGDADGACRTARSRCASAGSRAAPTSSRMPWARAVRDAKARGAERMTKEHGLVVRLPHSGEVIAFLADETYDARDARSTSAAERHAREQAWAYVEAIRALPGHESAYLIATGPGDRHARVAPRRRARAAARRRRAQRARSRRHRRAGRVAGRAASRARCAERLEASARRRRVRDRARHAERRDAPQSVRGGPRDRRRCRRFRLGARYGDGVRDRSCRRRRRGARRRRAHGGRTRPCAPNCSASTRSSSSKGPPHLHDVPRPFSRTLAAAAAAASAFPTAIFAQGAQDAHDRLRSLDAVRAGVRRGRARLSARRRVRREPDARSSPGPTR